MLPREPEVWRTADDVTNARGLEPMAASCAAFIDS